MSLPCETKYETTNSVHKNSQNVNTKYSQKIRKHSEHRRKINTEKKAKVVAADWGTELIQFLAALAILQ